MWSKRVSSFFNALKEHCYEAQEERFLEQRAKKFYKKRHLKSCFLFMRDYLKKKKTLRHRELEFNHIAKARSNHFVFYSI